MPETILMGAADVRRALTRIAHEIVERNGGCEGLLFVGMRTRGAPLAQRLVQAIAAFERVQVPIGALDVSLYRDDIHHLRVQPVVQSTDIPVDVTDQRVVLVDDVLFTGRSARAALDAIMDLGRPRSIQLAVLVDRGHRELPIRADYVGRNIPTTRSQQVQVRLVEVDGRDEVALITPPEEQP